jgi:Domain of unknown function (DUF5103)
MLKNVYLLHPIMKRSYLILIVIIFSLTRLSAQVYEDGLRDSTIGTPMLFPYGNQMGLPIIKLNSSDQLELHFDDITGGYKNYYYTFVLCNADWTAAMVSYFDFVKGYSNNRINTYRVSSIAQQKYTHYQAYLPERTCTPIKSGNYLLKVYLDGDTSKTVFTKRFMVYEEKVNLGTQIVQPLAPKLFKTHQRIITRMNTQSLNLTNAQQQLKIIILQNNRWDNAVQNVLPTFIRGKDIEYNNENDFVFQAGREWRWADLRSFRFWSDRVQKGEQGIGKNTIYLKPDGVRNNLLYSFYRDLNGMYNIETTDNINPYWQGDYAKVYFNFSPPGNTPYIGKELYLIGKMSNYALNAQTKMVFNADKGVYETSLQLKQGYYSYQYMLYSNNGKQVVKDINETEGNYWETENTYQVLVYFKPFGARVDELVGYSTANSLNGRTTIGF